MNVSSVKQMKKVKSHPNVCLNIYEPDLFFVPFFPTDFLKYRFLIVRIIHAESRG